MLESKLSRILLIFGATIGIAGVSVWAIDGRFLNLPDWIVQVAMVKLTFLGAAGLLGAGALLGRHAKRSAMEEKSRAALAEGVVEPFPGGEGVRVGLPRSERVRHIHGATLQQCRVRRGRGRQRGAGGVASD